MMGFAAASALYEDIGIAFDDEDAFERREVKRPTSSNDGSPGSVIEFLRTLAQARISVNDRKMARRAQVLLRAVGRFPATFIFRASPS
ncbi:hypothetical protein GCT13_02030 [Paraburkholderia sp. CNPSo 3157]|uniref:Uncharacterized protein n=1 Tax=Paraburkholderia franconis TaxID=2654983 RepID=A0A7X1N5P0_9BURK|nr:hypothetical protein [Paraburkholderia franconis]MPW15724.1 hypothetical protein [Paraburkholderia franconis]